MCILTCTLVMLPLLGHSLQLWIPCYKVLVHTVFSLSEPAATNDFFSFSGKGGYSSREATVFESGAYDS